MKMFSDSDWGALLFKMIVYGTGFILGAFGGMYSECSGIINIALEGSMIVGAFSGLLFLYLASGTALATTFAGVECLFFLAVIVVLVVSVLFSFLLSFVAVKFKANQTIVGTALNMVALALCSIINTSTTGIDSAEVANGAYSQFFVVNNNEGFVGSAFSYLHIGVFIGLLVIVILWLAMDRTRFGLRLRACGENPAAADSVGINVDRMRYKGTAIGSAAAGLGGFIIFSCLNISNKWTIDALGYGFLVLAVEILGNWKTIPIMLAALFFAFSFAFGNVFQAALSNITDVPKVFYTNRAFFSMVPYALAFLSLIFFSKHSHAPKAEGIPYSKDDR
jgi:general nucleoside transport system permease protein